VLQIVALAFIQDYMIRLWFDK